MARWRKGPPPHVGWWNASVARDPDMWRWWNGTHWSIAIHRAASAREIALRVVLPVYTDEDVRWTTYYPANARVPRVAP